MRHTCSYDLLLHNNCVYSSVASGNAPGNRGGDVKSLGAQDGPLGGLGNPASALGGGIGPLGSGNKDKNKDEVDEKHEGFGLKGEDVKGSLKIHLKLDLEADIRILARVRGDIAIGLL